MSSLPCLRPSTNETDIALLIVPKSSRNKIMGLHGDALKLNVTAPPTDGSANKAVIEFIADLLSLPKASVALKSGASSRRKTLRVKMSIAEVDAKITAHLEKI